MSMLRKTITNNAAPSHPLQWYWQDANWTASSTNRYSIQSPDSVQVDVGGVSLEQYSKQILDLSLDASWDVGQNVGTWAAEHTYAVGDLVRATAATIADGSKNNNTAYATLLVTGGTLGPYASGVDVTADGYDSASYAPSFAFNTNTTDRWQKGGAHPHYLKYDFGSGKNKIINKFRYFGHAGYSPKTWKFQGSNVASPGSTENSGDWTTLYTGTDVADPGNDWTSYFTFNNSTAYRHYRIYITNSWDGSYGILRELHLVEQLPLVYRASAITTGISSGTEPSWAITGDTTDTGVTWTAYTDYTGAMARAGQDFYIYAVARSEGHIPKFILSANATIPTGYLSTTSRKVAGFHCLCNSVGTISGHTLTGYVTGDIIPLSVWDLWKRSPATNGNVGQRYNSDTGQWVGIYPVTVSGGVYSLLYGGTIAVSKDWNDSVDIAKGLGMSLPSDAAYQSLADGSNEETVILGAALPTTVIGAVNSAGVRMISNGGSELCCGALDYWLDEQSYRFDGAAAHTHTITTTGAITGVTIASGGTATYAINDVLTIVSATGINGTVTVTGVTDGVVTGVSLTTAGTLYKNANNPHSTTGGGGTGCTLTITTAAVKTSSVASADVAPAFGWQALSGNKGSIYKQGTYGTVKLLAGGKATGTAANAGSRGRDAKNGYPWYVDSGTGIYLVTKSIDK